MIYFGCIAVRRYDYLLEKRYLCINLTFQKVRRSKRHNMYEVTKVKDEKLFI